jgi:hypothetical protein
VEPVLTGVLVHSRQSHDSAVVGRKIERATEKMY